VSIFDTHNGRALNETAATRSIPLPVEAQGAAFDKAGNLWITSSSSRFGRLDALDATTGQVKSSFQMVIGIEDLSFDDNGRIWTVSEAGSLRWQKWSSTFPILFRLEPGRLKEQR
jgi:streptogramin lyase